VKLDLRELDAAKRDGHTKTAPEKRRDLGGKDQPKCWLERRSLGGGEKDQPTDQQGARQ